MVGDFVCIHILKNKIKKLQGARKEDLLHSWRCLLAVRWYATTLCKIKQLLTEINIFVKRVILFTENLYRTRACTSALMS